MTDNLVLGLALSSRDWRSDLHRHCRDHEASVAVSLLRDGRDAFIDNPDVVILDDDTSWLSAPFVTKARESGIGIVGIFDPLEADGYGLQFLQRLGVDLVAPSTIGTDELLTLARQAQPDRLLAQRFSDVVVNMPGRVARPERRVIAVGGPAGAGATEVAVAFASQSAGGAKRSAVLVDVDETHPSVARRLGLGIHPHIITAVETLRGEASAADILDDAASLSRCLASPALNQQRLPFDTIVGLASRDDWSLLRADDVVDLIDELAAQWATVVVRLGPNLEDLARYVDRFGVSRAAAARADRVVGVCEATSTGVLRFVDWLVDVLGLIGDAPLDVVLNRCPRTSGITGQLVEQLRSIVGGRVGTIVEVPADRKVERAAWDAQPVGRGPFTRAIQSLVEVTS